MVLDSHIPLWESITELLARDYSDKKRFHSDTKRLHKAINVLKRPQNILKKKLILKLANGKKRIFQSFRVEHSDARGPFMGGTRYSSNLIEEDVKKLSILESIKSAIVDLPFGGAFGGISVDFKKVSPKDLERLTKLFAGFLTPYIGTWKDILTTEVGTNNETMNWMMEAYEKRKKFHSPAAFTNNSHNLDGANYVLEEYLKTSNLLFRFRKLDVAIYGFGNRGYTFTKNLSKQNFRVVAISDNTGGVVNSKGFDIEEIKKLKEKFISLKEVSAMEKIEYITNEKLLELPVDILVIGSENVTFKDVKAKLVLELCSSDINYKSSEILPNILLNSGFSVLAHLDWVQKMHGYKWGREEVSKKLHTVMIKTFAEVKGIVDEKKVSYKDACLYLGVKRIIDAMMERGRV